MHPDKRWRLIPIGLGLILAIIGFNQDEDPDRNNNKDDSRPWYESRRYDFRIEPVDPEVTREMHRKMNRDVRMDAERRQREMDARREQMERYQQMQAERYEQHRQQREADRARQKARRERYLKQMHQPIKRPRPSTPSNHTTTPRTTTRTTTRPTTRTTPRTRPQPTQPDRDDDKKLSPSEKRQKEINDQIRSWMKR